MVLRAAERNSRQRPHRRSPSLWPVAVGRGRAWALGMLMALSLESSVLATAELSPAETGAEAKPTTPTYQIKSYEITGSSVLGLEDIARLTADAIGDRVSVPEIRRALTRLQTAYRERGLRQVAVTLPQQSLSSGVVQVRVHENLVATETQPAPDSPVTLPAWTAPVYDIRHFEIYGNTKLTPEEIDRILAPAAGPTADLEQLENALVKLRAAYRERGLPLATVTVPQQLLTDGTINIQVNEGWDPEAERLARDKQSVSPAVPAAAKPETVFEVQNYDVAGNTLLQPETIDALVRPGIGTNVTFTQVRKVLGDLQLAYRERGFASVSVSLPPQQLTNAIIRVQVTEGVLVDARITGNRYFSSNNIMSALPTLAYALIWKDEVVNSRVLQRELDLANQNRDRQIYPVINPGPEPGTTAIELRVKDRLPLHGRLEVNNQATPGTPDWRVNASANYNNLWQEEHAFGIFYGFTPEERKHGDLVDNYLINRPLIANAGAYYRIPFGRVESVQQRINEAGNFGYDEATKQFQLPPPGARPDLTFSVSGSSSDTGVNLAPQQVVSQTPLLTIVSQDSGQDITLNRSAGANLNLPHAFNDTRRINFSLGFDWKNSERESYNTNNFIITTVVTNAQGSQIIESRVASLQPPRITEVDYLPLNLGFSFSDVSPRATFAGSLILSANSIGERADFQAASYTSRARAEYAKALLALNYDRKVFSGWSLLLRGNGQAATGPLISNEQFALGGVNSVRGYYEGDEYGDVGWFGSAELRTPFIATEAAVVGGVTPVWLRGSVFLDAGQKHYLDEIPGMKQTRFIWSAGFGLSANINNRFDAKLVVGVPLVDSANTEAREPRLHFSLGGQF
jgi:hemolysin activation/secretion protein